MENGMLGKKVFFLYPPPVLTEVVDELARQEFEVYLSREHEKLRKVLTTLPGAILFVNLDDGLDEAGWRSYVRSIRAETPAAGIGLVTLNEDEELREFYLMNLRVQCGFVILKIGATKTAAILTKTLEANEARGRRKFVRAACSPGTGQCDVDYEGARLKAKLTDLSSAGMAARFEGGINPGVGTVLRDMSLTIKGQRILVSGTIVATYSEGEGRVGIHVIMFNPGSLDEARREKLRSLVSRINQAAMDIVFERA